MKMYFKTAFCALMPFAIGLGFCYLLGSFIEVAFNTELWTREMRLSTVGGGIGLGVALYFRLWVEGLV